MVTRYEECDCADTGEPVGVIPCPDGRFVEYNDYAALEARIAELEKDAARWRWLCDKPWSSDEFGSRLRVAIQLQMNAIWGEVIDEAMSREA